MKIFVLGHPHTKTSPEFLHHGFTTKVWNLCKIFSSLGHEVIHLGVEGSAPVCSKHVSVTSAAFWEEQIGYQAHVPPVKPLSQEDLAKLANDRETYHHVFSENARETIRSLSPDPFSAIVCVTWGGSQWRAVEGLRQFVVEAGIGYYPQVTSKYRVFESNAWAHLIYGKEGRTNGDYWQDAVIPNATDPTRFAFRPTKDDYFLVMGRMNADKGIGIAVEVTQRLGKRLVLAGTPGAASAAIPTHVEFRPNVSEEDRKELMAGAKALFAPTRYPEPFGQVVIEAAMSGTPVISTDWGAFPETVLHGITGFRCRNIDQFLRAARSIDTIDPANCRAWALGNFSLEAVASAWDEYFRGLLALNTVDGWNTDTGRRITPANDNAVAAGPDRDWLRKHYPTA